MIIRCIENNSNLCILREVDAVPRPGDTIRHWRHEGEMYLEYRWTVGHVEYFFDERDTSNSGRTLKEPKRHINVHVIPIKHF